MTAAREHTRAKLPHPARPTLTAPFVCAMLFWAACASSYATGDVREAALSGRIAAGAIAGVALCVPLSAWRRARPVGLAAAALLAGAALGSAQAASVHAGASAFEGVSGELAQMTLLEDSRDFGFGESALVEARVGDAPPAVFTARFGDSGPLLTGERVRARVSFSAVDYSNDAYSWNDGSCGRLKASALERLDAPFPLDVLIGFRARAIERIGGDDDAHALLQALVCGYRRNISGTEMYSQFQACGLAHLVAVSGAHLVIVCGLAATALERARAPRRLTVAVLVAVMGCYFVVAGMPVSALRAMAMSALGLFAFFGRRRSSSLNAVGIATFAIIASSPVASVSASFVLSALSTAGIVLFSSLFQSWIARTPLGRFAVISDGLSLTFAASLLSQLYACSLFHQLPLVSPLANVACAPLFPLACGAGLASAVVRACFFAQATPLGFAATLPASLLAGVVSIISSVPYASIPFTIDTVWALALSAALALVLWALWPRPSWKGLWAFAAPALAVVLALSFFRTGHDAIIALDVGQGDAILVESRSQRYLVDTGNQDSKLLEQLALNHVTHLDGVIVSHADDDHCGSIDVLGKTVQVDRFILAADMLECAGASARGLVEAAHGCADEVVGVEVGDSFTIGAFTARVVWPHAFTEEGGNADSLCLALDYDGDDDGEVDFKALLTGDAEADELDAMLAEGAIGDVDLLKVGHHGSRNGSTAGQMAKLDPEVALISCGARNRYGHPTSEIIGQLDGVGAKTYRTDLDGEVKCVLTPERISVTCIS